jgi:hypothetical protein
MKADVQSFWDELEKLGIKILDTEVFTAHDRNKVAGTVDHLLWVPGYGKILGDKKTGDLKPLEFGVQIAEYRDGDIYDWETDTRTQWDDDVNADFALVLDIPAGKGKTEIHEIDLNYGRRMAALAAEVRDGHQQSRFKVRKNISDEILEHLSVGKTETEDMIESATSRDEMLAIRSLRWEWWGPEFDAICKARLERIAVL